MRHHLFGYTCLIVLSMCWKENLSAKPKSKYLHFGGIFDVHDVESKAGFLFGVSQYNNKQWKLFKLSSIVDVIDVKNSFRLASSICSHMSEGVFLIFGARPSESASIVQSYTQTFHIPYVSPTAASSDPSPGSAFQIHMKPSHTRALVGLIREYEWRTFHYVYDSEEGLYRIQEMIKIFEQNKYVTQNIRIRKIADPFNAHEDLRALDRMEGQKDSSDNSTDKLIVMDLSSEAAYSHIMKQIREVGMNKEGYKYILGTSDFLNLEMDRYRHGGVNITGLQLVNYSSPFVQKFLDVWGTLDPKVWEGAQGNKTIHIDAAVSVDAITLIHRTLSDLIAEENTIFKTTFRRGRVYNHNRTEGVPCDTEPPVPWMHGEKLMRGMKRIKFKGVTGNVEFDENGFRKNYEYDIYNVGLNQSPYKIGNWTSEGIRLFGDKSIGPEKENETEYIYVVTTIEDEPFVMKTEPKSGKPVVENERFEGYCIDLAKAIADVVKFDYRIQLVKDGKYGEKRTLAGNVTAWNGMVGELVRGDADIAVAPMSITSDREEVVDFSKPYMNFGISIMIKKPEKKKPGVFSFMQPFTLGLWLCIVFGYFSVGIGIFFVSRLSSIEWKRARYRKSTQPFNEFTLQNSLWFAMGSMMLQGSDDTCPRSSPGRIIGGAWWFAVLITISSYTANLAAFLTIEKLLTPIEGADDLVNQNDIAYGTLDAGSTKGFFKQSRVPTYKAMWNYMSSTKPSTMVQSMEEGIRRTREAKGKYAFLLESVYNEFANNQKPCDTMKVGHNLNSNHYGIATRKFSPLRDDITLAVLTLTEVGTLERLKKKWWVDHGQCGFDTGNRESKKKSLSLSNVAGAYFILIGGLVFSIIVGVCEFIYIKAKPEPFPPPESESFLPVADTVDTFPDTNGTDRNNLYHKSEMPASPVNGAARQQMNHFTYDPPAYSPLKLVHGNDSNTAV